MSAPDLSVIIPIFNRGDVIRYTLESVRRASPGLRIETIIVDDGSTVPVAETLRRLEFEPAVLHRQENRGLLFARLAGLKLATGNHVVFLDSDDLVTPEKFRGQLAAMASSGADVSSTGTAHCALEGDYDGLRIETDPPAAAPADAPSLYLLNQPPPHGPIFRADYLRTIVEGACFPPSPLYNNVAEIWFYYNAAVRPAKIAYVPGPLTIVGTHSGGRLTGHWERLAVASLAVMEAFVRACPKTSDTIRARQIAGSKAFHSWRGLPRGFSPEFTSRLLAVWSSLPRGDHAALEGARFQALARIAGSEAAGRLLSRIQNARYKTVRTMTDAEFAAQLAALPPP